MRYRWYRFGPWDEKFDECLSALRETGSIEAERYPFQGYYGSLYHNLATEEHHTLTDAEQAILDYLIQEYGQKCLKELLDDVVYETKPMKDAQERGAFNQALRMELVDNELRSGFGDVDFEELVAAEKDVQRGLSIPISEVLSGLERRNSSRGKP